MLPREHACTHAQTDGQVENIMPRPHPWDGRRHKAYKNVCDLHVDDAVNAALRPVGDEEAGGGALTGGGEVGRRAQSVDRKSAPQRPRDRAVDVDVGRVGACHVHVTGDGGDAEHGATVLQHRLGDGPPTLRSICTTHRYANLLSAPFVRTSHGAHSFSVIIIIIKRRD